MRAAFAAAAAATLIVAAGCSGSGDDGETRIRLVVPDKNIRTEDAECAGARPFHYVHAEAPFTIEGDDGDVVARGELPVGHAVNAEPEIDWGVDRIPTFCVFELDVDVPERRHYRFLLGRGLPLDFVASDEPVVLVVA